MNLELEAYEGELRTLRASCRALAKALQTDPFICGMSEDRDEMGLPERLLVCPYEGLDGFAVYTKTADYSAPGY
jgi:hypothetical protein